MNRQPITLNLNGASHAYGVGSNLQPANQPAIVVLSASGNSRTNETQAASGRTFVLSVGSSSTAASGNGQPDIVASGARKQQPSDGGGSGSGNASVVPLNRGYVVPTIVGECKHCQRPLVRKSRNGRFPTFCSAKCRVAAWRERKKQAIST